ncbi:uncharacterized protein DFL_001908 [Arthrobotrys flagrans]|uniref:DUF7729 domain-containing protein n=1 Tax=Arthrobotrys flagrans TaxID=97331 RepID=A0A437A9B5_ARTFL|nr:hypothetical protein DFL_001908 [Arthrobotrys flagrans]
MDRRSLKKSSFSSFYLYFTVFIIFLFSFTSAAPSQRPFEEEASLRIPSDGDAPTTVVPDLAKRTATYAPSTVRNSASTPTASSDSDGYVAPFPRAFDTSVALNNFTAPGCQSFFQSFLNNTDFIECMPLSFFIQNSKSWFDITKHGIVPVTQALTKSCGVDSGRCNSIMNELGKSLLDASTCGADFKLRNPAVIQAYASFISYGVMFAAGCQRSETGFCYADAVTSTNAADTYVYLMPLGISIPGGARLTCSTCLQKTMRIYSAAAVNTSLPISSTYGAGANLINLGCGPDFVNTSVAEAQIGSAVSLNSRTWISTISFIAILSIALL